MPEHRSTRRAAVLGIVVLAATLAGCGGVSITADNPVPPPLVEELPLRAGIYYSAEFKHYAAHEERASTKWQVELGAAHVAAIDRLTKAMFADVTPVADLAKLPAAPLDLILEPRFEEYSFLTPRDSGGELFAVTIKYRINIYDGQARLIDSLVLTGFGNELAGSLSSSTPLAVATRRAMRDAGAKFAAEFPEQPVIRKLVRHEPVEPIAQGTAAAAEGSIGEVQPTATKPAPAPRPAAVAPAPAQSTAAAGAPSTAPSGPQAGSAPATPSAGTGVAPAVPPTAPEAQPAVSPTPKDSAVPPTAPEAQPAVSPAPKDSAAPPTAPEAQPAVSPAPKDSAVPPTAPEVQPPASQTPKELAVPPAAPSPATPVPEPAPPEDPVAPR